MARFICHWPCILNLSNYVKSKPITDLAVSNEITILSCLLWYIHQGSALYWCFRDKTCYIQEIHNTLVAHFASIALEKQFCRKVSFSVPLNAKSSCRCGEQVNWLDWIFLEYLNRFNQRPKYTISWGKFTHSPDFNPDQGIRPPPFIKGYLGTM